MWQTLLSAAFDFGLCGKPFNKRPPTISKSNQAQDSDPAHSPEAPPENPTAFPEHCAATSFRTASSLIPRAFATRGIWNSAAAGVMSGSSPEAEVVTISIGTGLPGFSACAVAASVLTRSMSF